MLVLDAPLARAEGVAVDVAAEVEIEHAVAVVREPLQTARDEPPQCERMADDSGALALHR